MGAVLIYLRYMLTHTGAGAKIENRDKCPFRDTSQDWPTRRRCISTKAETRIDTEEIMSANNY
jgi:hypothetical protein